MIFSFVVVRGLWFGVGCGLINWMIGYGEFGIGLGDVS